MAREGNAPAIVREYSDSDLDTEVIDKKYDRVSFDPGLGNSGYRLETVEKSCPQCNFDRMIRRHDVNPTHSDEVRYWCLSPSCQNFVGEQFNYALNPAEKRNRSTPVITE